MAEYIDRKALLELINEDCKYQNPTNEYTRGCNEVCDWAIKTIKNMPAADVARGIFEELIKEASLRFDGFRNTIIFPLDYYTELKKKYTGAENNGN